MVEFVQAGVQLLVRPAYLLAVSTGVKRQGGKGGETLCMQLQPFSVHLKKRVI